MTWINKEKLCIVAACISLLLTPSCDIGDSAYCNSYITGYYDIPGIYVVTSDYKADDGSAYHRITVHPDSIVPLSSVFHDLRSDNGLYDEYCKLHKDTSYRTRLLHSLISFCYYPASDFCSISLTCLDEWDDSHRSNSSLGDIATVAAITIWPFIENGYTEYDYDLKDQPELFNAAYPFTKGYGKRAYYPVIKVINNLSSNDLKLLGDGISDSNDCQLCDIFIPKREDGSPCKLRVTMANTDGKVYNCDVTVQ